MPSTLALPQPAGPAPWWAYLLIVAGTVLLIAVLALAAVLFTRSPMDRARPHRSPVRARRPIGGPAYTPQHTPGAGRQRFLRPAAEPRPEPQAGLQVEFRRGSPLPRRVPIPAPDAPGVDREQTVR